MSWRRAFPEGRAADKQEHAAAAAVGGRGKGVGGGHQKEGNEIRGEMTLGGNREKTTKSYSVKGKKGGSLTRTDGEGESKIVTSSKHRSSGIDRPVPSMI